MEEFAEITVLIADRATLFRHGMRGLLKEHRPGWSCAEAGTPGELLAHLRAEPVDLVLLDLQLEGTGVAMLRRLREEFSHQNIIVLADHDDRAIILECLAAGANGYVLKSATMNQLLRALEIVLSGGVFAPGSLTGLPLASPAPVARAIPSMSNSPLLAHLTDRQLEVLNLLSEGCATKTIARRLDLAVGTVKVHLAAIYRVLGAHNRVEALARARSGDSYPRLTRAIPELESLERAGAPSNYSFG
jgi:DNA-binding NarL/FixJ family response regulator